MNGIASDEKGVAREIERERRQRRLHTHKRLNEKGKRFPPTNAKRALDRVTVLVDVELYLLSVELFGAEKKLAKVLSATRREEL